MSTRKIRNYFYYFTGQAEYLFVHIPKNAGVTIRSSTELQGRIVSVERMFLISRDYDRRLTQAMEEIGHRRGLAHARLRDISTNVREKLQPFAIVRNPWARVVSRFAFSQKARNSPRKAHKKSLQTRQNAPTFEEFLEERHVWGNREFYWHRAVRGWYPQVDYLNDETGNFPVHVLRSENLDEEAVNYFGLSAPLGRRNVSNKDRTDYRSFYNDKTIQIVADWYAADIERFGFDFDTPAQRNYYFEPK